MIDISEKILVKMSGLRAISHNDISEFHVICGNSAHEFYTRIQTSSNILLLKLFYCSMLSRNKSLF